MYDKIFEYWKASQSRFSSSEKSTHERVIEHSPYISVHLKREQVLLSPSNSRMWHLIIVFMAKKWYYFKILAAQDKAVFGRCASVSRYVKKYCSIMILTWVKSIGSLIGKPWCVVRNSWRKTIRILYRSSKKR